MLNFPNHGVASPHRNDYVLNVTFKITSATKKTTPVDIRAFLLKHMSMTANYQPVVIRELLLQGGSASVEQLTVALMMENQNLIKYWRSILMKWPKQTLTNRRVVQYNRKQKRFTLLGQSLTPNEIHELIAICTAKIVEFNTPVIRREAARRFQVIENAKGMCQACFCRNRPLDVDHIVPREVARKNIGIWRGKVPNKAGKLIDLDDMENLQVLCEKCNRGKRDQGKFHDFRPSEDSLIIALHEILSTAKELNIAEASLISKAKRKAV